MAVGILWETLRLLLTDSDFTLAVLIFGVGLVMILSILEAWRYVKEARNL